MRFESPWALLLLLVIPALVYARRRYSGKAAVYFSSTAHAAVSGKSARQRLLVLPPGLRIAVLTLFVLALARPQQGQERVRDVTKGVAIEMVVDRSGSMSAEMTFGRERLNRLEVVKRVFNEFVSGNGKDLPGRPDDLIGLVSFARYPDTACPLTLGHGALLRFVENVQLVTRESEDGTAIGDALALAAARLKTAEETVALQRAQSKDAYEIKSKVIILLTDGMNNYGKRMPDEAAALAAEWGIKIYTIGVGSDEPTATIRTPLGDYVVPARATLDERMLKRLADRTGGIYRRADDAASLRAVYEEIDRLEKTEIESVRYTDYREWFTPFALTGLVLLMTEVMLSCTIFRRLP